jgi:hypothetical protein
MKTNIHFLSNLPDFFLQLKVLQTDVVEKIETHVLYYITFFIENRAVYEIIWESSV